MSAMPDDRHGAAAAAADFQRARRRADVRAVLSLLSGHTSELLPYEEVRHRLHAVESAEKRLEEVPLDAIVGSLGRYQDFSREFMPLQDTDRDRWVGVKLAMTGLAGVPPIDVYRVGDAYFVKDGNHRVSVARQLGARFIQAYVTPVHTRVRLSPGDSPDDLIIKSEYAMFLEETRLDELRPDADLSVTVAGQYEPLLEHIRVHRYFMGIDFGHRIAWEEGVTHWYDTVYLPVVDAIRIHGLLRGFEGRTETDLYLFLAEHRARLERAFGWQLPSEAVAAGLSTTRTLQPDERAGELMQAARLEPGRRREVARLVHDVLVLQRGADSDPAALHTALRVAAFEGAALYGLRLDAGESEHEALDADRLRFEVACEAAGVTGQYALTDGEAVREVRERAAFFDLVVAAPVERVSDDGEDHIEPTLHGLLRRCPRPLLVARHEHGGGIRRPVLAYDGGGKADEALFVLAYTAVKRDVRPVVVTVADLVRGMSPLQRARAYLEGLGVVADYVERRGGVADAISWAVEEFGCDAIFMGSYKYNRWLEDVVGGILERVLLSTDLPVLVT